MGREQRAEGGGLRAEGCGQRAVGSVQRVNANCALLSALSPQPSALRRLFIKKF